ncbi:MAG: hypothetical protein AB7U98_14815 [Candidatus Nitrosocosmicus sp.]
MSTKNSDGFAFTELEKTPLIRMTKSETTIPIKNFILANMI